jgi:DNA methyltransferase 1-associated protein 1
MLGLPGADAQKTAVQKRPKATAPQRKFQGVAREVAALYGERPPPVAVYEEKKSYRAKRQNAGPAKKWIQQPFTNPARSDGLTLKHWRRKPVAPQARLAQEAVTNGEDTPMEDAPELSEEFVESDYEFARFNVLVEIPQFTDQEYEAHLQSADWTREETDYLLSQIQTYCYRWAVIWDRYDYQPATKLEPSSQDGGVENTLSALPFASPRARSVEDLKARFYDISAKLMRLRIPEVQMDAEQYARYELLNKFDPLLERNRKSLATALMNRNMDEVKEEEFLLTELQRINMAANRLDAERAELRNRLEAPTPNAQAAALASFQSSAALNALFQQLFAQDKSKKRASGSGPARLSLSATDIIGTPTTAQHSGGLNSANARRQSNLPQQPMPTPIRTLSPATEYRFNVSTHDRLTSGVSFGSDKLLKMRQAKSNVQTQKIAAALAQLGIPELIPIPTSKVGEVFEKLIGRVSKLLDVRKVREKEDAECKVLFAMKERRSQTEGGGNSNPKGEGAASPGGSEAPESSGAAQRHRTSPKPHGTVSNPHSNSRNDAYASGTQPVLRRTSTAGTTRADSMPSQEGLLDVDAEGEEDDDDNDDVDNDDDDDEGDEDGDEDAVGEEVDTPASTSGSGLRSEGLGTAAIGATAAGSGSIKSGSATAGHKRSASVLSQSSNKSVKRVRKGQ